MKESNLILLFLLLCGFFASHAQEFYGEATYKTHRKLDIKLDSTQVNSDMHQMMVDMMKKQFQKTYILSFNKSESLYLEDEQLGAPQPSGMQIVVMDTGGSDKLYKNIAELPQKAFNMQIDTEAGPLRVDVQPEMQLYLNGKEHRKHRAI